MRATQNFKECDGYIETSLTGKNLMTTPQLNKGTAFTQEELETFGLLGKVPARIETLEEQVKRAYFQFSEYTDDLQKHIYLNNLNDKNQVLFYKVVTDHLAELFPLIYTPHVATAVQEFSLEFRQARGLFISYENRDQMDFILDNRTNPDIDLIVVTDGEGVLGIGDQGVGSINIPIAKLMVYTLCAGISPLKTLPIYLDVGTNNKKLLEDPYYLGARHPRISKEKYDEFIAQFVDTISKKFPKAFLHFEDFGRDNARRILDQYQNKIRCFNDDIQGTGAAALAAVLAGVKKSGGKFDEQRIVIFGAGTAGVGIADQLYRAMRRHEVSEKDAREKFWLVDRFGLITADQDGLTTGQIPYARKDASNISTLVDIIKLAKPTILIGCSAQHGAFTQDVIETMASFVEYPIILPLSNPTEKAEAIPEDLITWTKGKALIATGSPFKPVVYNGKIYTISQCNNSLVYPGIGLGVIASRPTLFTDDMLWAACVALSELSGEALLPTLSHARESSLKIASAIARAAGMKGDVESHIKKIMWEPKYVPLKKALS
ncbi:MAG TPA: NAD-dependent malic enzyme [Gammaproteobacteria bacterium]|nr:NAD-dependent malic enzyme [Gammaproteobacteria bacterium]